MPWANYKKTETWQVFPRPPLLNHDATSKLQKNWDETPFQGLTEIKGRKNSWVINSTSDEAAP